MDSNFEDNAKCKPRRSSQSRRKQNSSRFRSEAIKVTIEKKKQCTTKAVEVVTNFSDGTISENCLIENLQFINQEYYQDIIEERAINKICGYPLCPNKLKSTVTKQFHISTIHNKVFDITDRKNFCSNLCYKASKYLKHQISTSPLWLKEDLPHPAEYKLISLQSKGGIAGDEVDFGHKPISPDCEDIFEIDNPTGTEEPNKNDMSNSTEEVEEVYINESVTNTPSIINYDFKMDHLGENIHENLDVFSLPCNTDEGRTVNTFSNSYNLNSISIENEGSISHKTVDRGDSRMSLSCSKVTSSSGSVNPLNVDCTVETNTSGNKNITSSKTHQDIISKSDKKHSKRKSSKKEQSFSPLQNVVIKVEQFLKEWLSVDSLCFIFGKEKIMEILAEKKSSVTELYNVPGSAVSANFYEQYLAVCRKLNMLELEDSKLDASFREEIKKPLPDYEALKKEAKQLDLKVKMFYRGDKVVQFEEPLVEPKNKDDEPEPILPIVDLHAQNALRRRIVIDKLRKVLQDLQTSLHLKGFCLNEDVRTLTSTFTLSAHNITMKPAEWNLIAIVLIKLLSIKDKTLDQALRSSFTSKHLTLLLMSYSLDGNYLDRLIVWLTEIDTVLQKK